ncbi:GyrI-like domain-containing protein [Paucisalibacillus globulus]|uniref:GyrI-like domain-containing protein n=1 Tax=Paucisalibacillus globulus TaxID=351095 RepID=UPI0004108BDB|nr:GyrI-like domain-containing protein [Paucisalibacillus globulus]
MKVIEHQKIIKGKELKLVGFRVLCQGEQYMVEIPKAVIELERRVSEIRHAIPSVQIGAFVVETEKEEKDGYWICVEVEQYEDIPDGMVTLTIPSQRYATWHHNGPNIEIMGAYNKLHNWMLTNKYRRLTDRWHLEVYYDWRNPSDIDVVLLDTIE